MVKFIEKATKEFEKNGRSKLFVAMENKVINSGKPMQMYYFARYAKGASVNRLQKAINEAGTLEQCYYFAKFVRGAQIRPFVVKSLIEDDKFWTEKFIELAQDRQVFGLIADIVVDFKPAPKSGLLNRLYFDSNDIIAEAKQEYEKKGRSAYFVELEKYCLHSKASVDSNLFIQHVPGVNVKAFERVAILKGDPFSMFMVATTLEGSNPKLMRDALEMAKHDYVEIARTDKDRINRKLNLIIQIKQEKDPVQRKYLLDHYKRLPTIPEYVARIDGRYIPRVEHVMRKQGIQK